MGAPRKDSSRAPLALAVVAAGLMVWLAGAPLTPPPAPLSSPGGGPAALLEPGPGLARGFPRRFAWTPVQGADEYVVTVMPAGGTPLFRQRGQTTELLVSFDEGAEPASGEYVWEVAAFAAGRSLGTASGAFSVAAR